MTAPRGRNGFQRCLTVVPSCEGRAVNDSVDRLPAFLVGSGPVLQEATMSADNWTYCPKCKAKDEARKASQLNEAEEAYGKVTAAEYADMIAAAREVIDLEETLREDYQIGIHNGQFEVGYRCSCGVCGFCWSYKHGPVDVV